MAGTEFTILAKVKLQADDVQKQLDDLSKNHEVDLHANTEDFELSLSVANAVMREFIEIANKMIDQVYLLDKAMVEFKKVSNLRGAEFETYVQDLTVAGETTARTTAEMVEAATMFRKSGFSDEEAKELATMATLFQNISDVQVSAQDAAASIVSQIQAFGRGAIEPIHILDAYNRVAADFAIGTGDLSKALELSAAGMATYGNTFEEIIG